MIPTPKDNRPVTADASYYVHYLSYDPQGGYWPVSPKGPYTNLNEARTVALRMKQNDLCREVRLVLRTETEISIVGGTWPI